MPRVAGASLANHPETLRRHALKVGEAIGECAAARPEVAAPAVVVTLDSTFIRSCEKAERHLEVRASATLKRNSVDGRFSVPSPRPNRT